MLWVHKNKEYKSYRCPKFGGDAKQTLEIRVERKRNLKLGELGEVSFGIYKLGQLGELSFGILKLGQLGDVSFGILKLGELGEVSLRIYKLGELVRWYEL
mgnify:CR=1 FL=1